MKKVALITGITGQDGAYLAELLLKKGYTVHGLKRRSSLFNTDRIDHLYQDPHVDNRNLILHYGDMTDSMNLTRIIQETQPDEIYNLSAIQTLINCGRYKSRTFFRNLVQDVPDIINYVLLIPRLHNNNIDEINRFFII